jgi:hypothetical protein
MWAPINFLLTRWEPSLGYLLQDRSYETGDVIGIEGRQRGYPKQKDQYVMAEITVSFNLTSLIDALQPNEQQATGNRANLSFC